MAIGTHTISVGEVTFATPDPIVWTHTPAATHRCAIVLVGHSTLGTDTMTGVTYGGVAMVRVRDAFDVAGEPGSAYAYFLDNIAAGAQTVSVNHTGSTGQRRAWCITFPAGGEVEVLVSGEIGGDAANPQITLDTGAASGRLIAIAHSGWADPSDLVPVTGCTTVGSDDSSAKVVVVAIETANATGSRTIGWTASTEDVAMVAIGITEVSGGGGGGPPQAADLVWSYTINTGPGNSTPQADPNDSIGGFFSSTPIPSPAVIHELFDLVTGAEEAALDDEYRVVAWKNMSTTGTMTGCRVWIESINPNSPDYAIALDGSGVKSVTSATAQTERLTNEEDVPTGESFTSPTDKGTGIGPFTLAPLQGIAVIVRRTTLNEGTPTDFAGATIRAEGTPS